MNARLVRYRVDPARCEEALKAFGKAAEDIGDLEGMKAAYVMIDQEDQGRILSLTVWENQAALEGSEVRATRLRQDALDTVEGEIESVERFRISSGNGA